ncbi:MAG: lytic transglycosylase domain-containing protein, partial [Bacteroidia bacterium]
MNFGNWWYNVLNWKKHIVAFFILLLIIAIIKLFNTIIDADSEVLKEKIISDNYKEFKLNIPPDLNFAGEPVPIEDFSVRDKIDKEFIRSSFWTSKSTYHIKRAMRWFPIIEPILKEYNIPDDFKYVAMVESGFTNTVSPKGATGFWQFIQSTAIKYDLEVNEYIDERFNVEKSTIAACKFLNDAYKELGSWTLVAAAYNRGIGGILKQIEKQGYNNYYNLYLNSETARYIFKILAIKEI